MMGAFTSDIWPVWTAADIALVPSIEPEPFGRVAIEAMACGLPVVAANHGGLTEIVQDGVTGYLVTPGSAQALADAVERLSKNESLRMDMGQAGARRQVDVFSQAAHDQKILNLIGEIDSSSRNNRARDPQ
jgi:glycosyltransferase involved in cell wall biosynthesis